MLTLPPEAATKLETEKNIWVASVRPDGRPHLAPVWFAWHAGKLYLCTGPGSVKARNISQNPRVALALEDGSHPVICEGIAAPAPAPGSAEMAKVAAIFRIKYDWGISSEEEYTQLLEVTPTKWLTLNHLIIYGRTLRRFPHWVDRTVGESPMKRTTVWLAALVLLFGIVLLASAWLISTFAPTQQPKPTLQMGALAARTPTPQPTASVPGNLLTNPSFEPPYAPQQFGEINVAQGWKAWYIDIPPCKPWKPDCYIPCPANCIENGACMKDYGCMWARPEFGPMMYAQFTYRVHTGEASQKYFSFARMHEAGLYQQVTGIVPGSPLEFSAWFQAWMCFDFSKCDYGRVTDEPGDMHLRIGIDPTGGTVPTSTNVIWSPEAPAFDRWAQFSVRATARSNVVTIFTHSRAEWAYAHANNDVYLDDASLVVAGPPADFTIQPAQPELGQATTVQVTSQYPFANAALAIADPHNAPVAPDGGAMSGTGTGPFVWAWQFTPTVSGTYQLAFSADALPAPVTSTVSVIAAAHLTAQPSTAWLSQTVTIQASAFYLYPSQRLTVTDPVGNLITPTIDDGETGTALYIHTWRMASLVTGTHYITFTADLLPAPVTASVNVTSVAGVDSSPVAPPVSTTVSLWAWAYYPYANVAMVSTDPQGAALPLTYLGQSSGPPYVWTWIGTPVITGTHVYTFTADGLDVPARGLIFAGGTAVYLPVIFKQ